MIELIEFIVSIVRGLLVAAAAMFFILFVISFCALIFWFLGMVGIVLMVIALIMVAYYKIKKS
jgi:hypothetical protein